MSNEKPEQSTSEKPEDFVAPETSEQEPELSPAEFIFKELEREAGLGKDDREDEARLQRTLGWIKGKNMTPEEAMKSDEIIITQGLIFDLLRLSGLGQEDKNRILADWLEEKNKSVEENTQESYRYLESLPDDEKKRYYDNLSLSEISQSIMAHQQEEIRLNKTRVKVLRGEEE